MANPAKLALRLRAGMLFAGGLTLLAIVFAFRLLDAANALAADPHTGTGRIRDLAIMLVIGAFICGLAVSLTAATLAVAPLTGLTRTARAMRRDLGIRTRVRGADEVGQLGQAMDELANWLASEKSSLEDDRNRLIAILESMAEGVLVTGPKSHGGLIVLANAALRQMLLLDRAIMGRAPMEVIRVAGLDEILESTEETADGASGEIELGGIRPRRILVRAAPLRGDAGDESPGLVAVFNDVTELRRLENVRRDFVANVSHELRTPITAISSATETLLGGALDDAATARDFVGIVSRHAHRLRELVEDLLELSRIESREWRLTMASVDPREACEGAIEAVAVAATQRSATLKNDVPSGFTMVQADRRALEQVLVNLIDNALKYGGTKPTVTIDAKRVGRRIAISVRDRGPGIEPRHLSRIFERFYRVDAGRARAIGGTGLGLSIVKHLVEAMGGTVEVESHVGVGTTFIVSLKERASEHPPAPPPEAKDERSE